MTLRHLELERVVVGASHAALPERRHDEGIRAAVCRVAGTGRHSRVVKVIQRCPAVCRPDVVCGNQRVSAQLVLEPEVPLHRVLVLDARVGVPSDAVEGRRSG